MQQLEEIVIIFAYFGSIVATYLLIYRLYVVFVKQRRQLSIMIFLVHLCFLRDHRFTNSELLRINKILKKSGIEYDFSKQNKEFLDGVLESFFSKD